MKLIIDIPEELVEEEHFYTEEELWTVIRATENGIPLDDVKTEIKQFAENPDFGDLSLGVSCGAIKAIEIIDKCKAEKESE